MHNGCILNGGVGSGKSRTALYYFWTSNGGSFIGKFEPPKIKQDLYIITTAATRDKHEWDKELLLFNLDREDTAGFGIHVYIDSWNNITKYATVRNAFFIFDEDRVTGTGVWAKTFMKIAKNNKWIICSATPGDRWEDYIPVFLANGFYRTKTEFINEHAVYSPYIKWKIDKWENTRKLVRLRDRILVDLEVDRHTKRHNIDELCQYDRPLYKQTMKTRVDPYTDLPIEQAAGLCFTLRKIVNSDESREVTVLELFEDHPKLIIFYNYDYERDILLSMDWQDAEIAEWNGHKHQEIPRSNKWIYLVQYNAGCEGWNCILTDTIVFYSQTYSYKQLEQACGRIDRMNTPFVDLYYYHLRSTAPIDLAIKEALTKKKLFNERRFADNADERRKNERGKTVAYPDRNPRWDWCDAV